MNSEKTLTKYLIKQMSSTYIISYTKFQNFVLLEGRAEIKVSNLLFYLYFTNLVSVVLWRAAGGTLTLTSFALFILGARK